MIIEEDREHVRIITLNHPNKHNPFNLALEESIKQALYRANNEDGVHAIVVYGGDNRSFSAGGDFNEVKNLSRSEDIDAWIDRVIDLYQAVLQVKKPTIAAINGYAIGMGFQFALMFDQRVMSTSAFCVMPELKHGIGCSLGAAILRFTQGFSTMQNIIYQSTALSADACKALNITQHIIDKDRLLDAAVTQAEIMARYPVASFYNTKQTANAPFISLLDNANAESKKVHRAAFQARYAQEHFKRVLGNNY